MTHIQTQNTHAGTALLSAFAFICFYVMISHCPCRRLCVVVCERAQAPLLSSCPSPLLPSPTCRGMQPSRGVPRGCLPGLDFVSLSADVFVCLRSRSPCPRSPRQRPRPHPHHRSQRHWPALMLSGKVSLARLALAWPTRSKTLRAAVFAFWSSPALRFTSSFVWLTERWVSHQLSVFKTCFYISDLLFSMECKGQT